jgi:hypothetical protein
MICRAKSSQPSYSFVFLGAHPNRDEGLEPIEVLNAGTEGLRADQIEPHVGYAADIDLHGGTKLCGVIVAVSTTSLIIERWDSVIHATNGELSTVAIDSVARISIQ